MYISIYVYIIGSICVHTYICVHIYIYICIICTYIYIHIHIHIHTCLHTTHAHTSLHLYTTPCYSRALPHPATRVRSCWRCKIPVDSLFSSEVCVGMLLLWARDRLRRRPEPCANQSFLTSSSTKKIKKQSRQKSV